MRLLYVCSDFGVSPEGTKGASIHLRAITGQLSRLGHEVLLLSPRGGPDTASADHPAQRILAAGMGEADRPARRLKRWLSGHGLDPGYAREVRSLLYGAWAGDQVSQPLADNPPNAVIERLSLFSYLGADLAERFGVPLVVEANAPLASEARTFRSLRLAELAETIEARVLHRADAVLCVSKPLADHFASSGVPERKLHVVPNGVDIELFDKPPSRVTHQAAPAPSGSFVVGFVGSLKVWHGVDVLLEAFRRLHDQGEEAKLVIVGTGPMEAELRQAAARSGLNDVVAFRGAVAHEEVPAILGTLDVAVAPFRAVNGGGFYFSPIKLYEYMAAGRCVVASRLGQMAEVVHHGENGLLCNPDDPADLCAQLDLARRSPALRERLGRAARELVMREYTWERTACRTVRIVEDLVGGSRGEAAAAASRRLDDLMERTAHG